jgi:hypothetical protein
MLWLKRNWLLVVTIFVAVVLTGVGGFYVYTKKALNDDLTTKLDAAKHELTRLTTEVKPSPTPENVRAAREDVKKSQEYSLQCRKFFVATPYVPLTSQSYRTTLETRLAELRKQAQLSGVELATNYAFSFDAEIKPMTFELASLKPLSDQLTEVSEVCRALFSARIHELVGIRRVAVSQYDLSATSGADILQGVTITSNRFTGMTVWPYEFTCECFSSELAGSLEALSKIPRMLLVKTINVEISPSAAQTVAAPNPAQPAAAPAGPLPVRRGPGRPGLPVVAPGAPKAAGLTTVLEEKLLRAVIQVQVIKPGR